MAVRLQLTAVCCVVKEGSWGIFKCALCKIAGNKTVVQSGSHRSRLFYTGTVKIDALRPASVQHFQKRVIA